MFKSIYNFFHRHYHLRYHDIYRHAKKLFVFDIFLLLVAMSMLVATIYFYLWTPGLTDQIDLKISLGANRIKSGELVKVTIDYTNRSKFYLREPILALHLPAGFIVDRTLTPTNNFRSDSTFNIEELRPGASGEKEVYGHIWITPKQDERITALLSYLPEKSNNREQKLGSFLVNLADSVLKSSLEVNNTSFANNHLPFTYKLVNTSDQKLEGINFNINFPGKINNIKNSDLENITLEKNAEKILTGDVIIPNKPGSYDLNVLAFANINNQKILLTNNLATVKTFAPEISISAKITDSITYVSPNQNFNTKISWQNNGQYELQNSSINIAFTPGIVDLKKTAKENNIKTDGTNLIITASERTALSNGRIGANDDFDLKIFLLPTFANTMPENSNLEIKPTFVSELKTISDQQFSYSGETEKIPLSTELSVASEARFYSNEGDQLGRGPLPLQVGETTKYWIFVKINNTTNPVRDISFSASLSDNISFTGKQSVSIGPAINYSESNHTLNWNFRELPANSQTGLYFEVAVTPNPEQVGKNINLINSIKLIAHDKNTGKTFSLNNGTVNNILPAIDMGSKKSSKVE